MDKPHKRPTFAVPREPVASSERTGWTPDEVTQYIGFQLSDLAGTNGHHEFERLCFQLARKRIYPNIIPSTGPVSAGGDQGSDFETYEVPVEGSSVFFAKSSEGQVIFACSIEKAYKRKIKKDLASIVTAQPSARTVKFFSNCEIPVAVRHGLKAYAETTHGIQLEIFDRLAIANLLADPEVFWIATRFLSIPGHVFVEAPLTGGDSWYREIIERRVDSNQLNAATFFQIKRALRHATWDESKHSDLPILIAKLRLFRDQETLPFSRRAFYEEFVASLRGLEFIDDCSPGLEKYFSTLATLADAADIEDSAILIFYAFGAQQRGLLPSPLKTLLGWRTALLSRIQTLLSSDVSPGMRGSLLHMHGFLALLNWLEDAEHDSSKDITIFKNKSAEAAFRIWQKMLKQAKLSPMFPLQQFAHRLALMAPDYGNVTGYAELSQQTDQLLAARAGQNTIGELAFERAKAFLSARRPLDAIDQLHIAHVSSFTAETALDTVYMPLFLAKSYSEVGLYAAAKYYALASSFAALHIREDELRPYIYRGLAEAAASDHANGASLNFFLALKATVLIASQFSASGDARVQEFEWSRLHFYAFILVYAASFINEVLANYLSTTFLAEVGLQEIYVTLLSDTEVFFRSLTSYPKITARAMGEGIAPPFCDAAAFRKLAWTQLDIEWTIEWFTDYVTTAMAEGFVGLLQILLTDLREVELSLFVARVHLTITTHQGEWKIEEIPSNDQLVRKLYLPEQGIAPEQALGIAATILKMVSAWPHEKFLSIIERRMKLGLLAKTNPHAPYDVLFREFYITEDYDQLHRLALVGTPPIPSFMIATNRLLRGPSCVHPDYDSSKSHKQIENRYTNTLSQLRYTLPRLLKAEKFRSTVITLRQEGWKDWHILLAICNLRLNFVGHTLFHTSSAAEYKTRLLEIGGRSEKESDPQPPVEEFTIEQLKINLRMTQLGTLKGLGFDCWQPTPVYEAIGKFLARFNYWSDDVPHPDPFVSS